MRPWYPREHTSRCFGCITHSLGCLDVFAGLRCNKAILQGREILGEWLNQSMLKPRCYHPTPFSLVKITWIIMNIYIYISMAKIWPDMPLQWRHNGRDGVSNHQPHDCLLNRLFRRRSKKTSKLRVSGLCAGNSPVTGEFPAQMASNAENVSIW